MKVLRAELYPTLSIIYNGGDRFRQDRRVAEQTARQAIDVNEAKL